MIKRLSNLDTKTFRGERGTAYIALPKDVAQFLPMNPAGENDEPRVDIAIEARLDAAPDQVVTSGVATTNITHVGMGRTASSHSDLRLNYLQVVATGIRHVVALTGATAPIAGDLAAIEFLDGVRVRITFIADAAVKPRLEPLLNERANGWGWLPPGVIEGWDVDEEASP
ncbi:MAG: hypothetical protein IPL43_11720 [Micropruina sp.]|nr:hypothetical protein [Micropruina sp.]